MIVIRVQKKGGLGTISLSTAQTTSRETLEMGIGPTQFTKAAHRAKRWVGALPSLYIKAKENASKYLTRSKIFVNTSTILQ